MQGQQSELWETRGAELLPIPPLYQELSPGQRRQIIERLARLILKQIQMSNIPNTDAESLNATEPTDQPKP